MAELEARCFPVDAWSEATFWAELALRPRRRYVVVEGAEGRLLGYGGIDLAGDVADVMTLAVDPERRGAGTGAMLLDGLHGQACAAGAQSMMLEVRSDNEAALRLYGSRGYTQLRIRTGYYPPSGLDAARVDALVMRKELGPA